MTVTTLATSLPFQVDLSPLPRLLRNGRLFTRIRLPPARAPTNRTKPLDGSPALASQSVDVTEGSFSTMGPMMPNSPYEVHDTLSVQSTDESSSPPQFFL